MPERAEIEAVARELRAVVRDSSNTPAWRSDEFFRERATRILDRVRDARGDEEAQADLLRIRAALLEWEPDRARDFILSLTAQRLWPNVKAARSPQREDHEVGIEAARQVLHGYVWHERLSDVTRATVAAYLSRVSSSRDGTVAVEALVRLAELCVDDRQKVRDGFVHYASEFEGIVEDRGNVAERALAEFGSARAGENNER